MMPFMTQTMKIYDKGFSDLLQYVNVSCMIIQLR